MKVKIWGDFACPFCYMGETTLEKVIAEMSDNKDIDVDFRAFELNPKAPVSPEETMTEHFMKEHGLTREEAEKQMVHITKMASRVGLEYNLKDVKVCSTFDAHRLMKFAKDNADTEVVKKLNFALFMANFVETQQLSDRQVLIETGESVGLDGKEIAEMFASDIYIAEIHEDEAELEEKNFEFIPYMEFEDGTVLQGVVSPGALKKALT